MYVIAIKHLVSSVGLIYYTGSVMSRSGAGLERVIVSPKVYDSSVKVVFI